MLKPELRKALSTHKHVLEVVWDTERRIRIQQIQ